MRRTRLVVVIRAIQLLVSMVLAIIAVDLLMGILGPETRGVVKIERAALITIAALAVSAAGRVHRGNRHRKV